MRAIAMLCVASTLILGGCGKDCDTTKTAPSSDAGITAPPSDTASATTKELDALGTAKVDVSNVTDDQSFNMAVDEAWTAYQTDMDSVPSAYTTAAPKLQVYIEELRAKDMKSYLAWMDAKNTNNYNEQFYLEQNVPALKEYKAAEASVMKEEAAAEAEAKKAKRVIALRKYVTTVVALYKGYLANDKKSETISSP